MTYRWIVQMLRSHRLGPTRTVVGGDTETNARWSADLQVPEGSVLLQWHVDNYDTRFVRLMITMSGDFSFHLRTVDPVRGLDYGFDVMTVDELIELLTSELASLAEASPQLMQNRVRDAEEDSQDATAPC